MSGHSKWANIKHHKQSVDAKKGKIFTKLAKEMMVAAKLGGSDEHANPRLKAAVLKARSANMPRDNIERAIKKGAGELDSIVYEEIVYEGYGPHGIAIMIEVMTDKKSRTVPEIKNIFTKAGGSMAEAGAVSYLFELCGIIAVDASQITENELLEMSLEAGAEDLESETGAYIIKTKKEDFHRILDALNPKFEAKGIALLESSLKYVPSAYIPLEGAELQSLQKLIENLENHDDVQEVYTSAIIDA